MKLYNIDNLEALFNVIDKCEGKVELVGDDLRLNLKSKLAQYFSLAEIFSNGDTIKELELIAYNPDDVMKLMSYMRNGK